MSKRRYPGVSPFTGDQKNIFFGRDNDINKLHKLILLRKKVLLYSKSGIGKTSLLNAGVLPKIEADFTIIKIRFFAYDNENSQKPVDKIINAIQNIFTIKEQKTQLDLIIDKTIYKKTLWYYFKNLHFISSDNLKTPDNLKFLLIFDQFEELFSYPQEQVNQFKLQLYELLNIDLPNEINQYIAANPEIDKNEQSTILYDDLNIKLVFAIRSDCLSLLNGLTDKIPDIQETFYELKPLDNTQAIQAITEPARDSNSQYESPEFEFERQAIDKIMNALTDNGKQNIETTQLQIVCQRIEENVILNLSYQVVVSLYSSQRIEENMISTPVNNPDSVSNAVRVIKPSDIPAFKDIFLNFYDNAVASLVEVQQPKARIFIEDQLIRNNQRISLDEIICLDNVTKESLTALVNTHLLRAERNSTGGYSYELSHDTLVTPIQETRKARLEREEEEGKLKIKNEELKIAKEQAEKERIEREKLEEFNRKINAEKTRSDKLLMNSDELLRLLVEGEMTAPLLYEHFLNLAQKELENLNFEEAARFCHFARLSPDLPKNRENEVKSLATEFKIFTTAIELYKNGMYKEAKEIYLRILEKLPGNEIILKRIEYCKNPVFNRDNFILVKGGRFMMGNFDESTSSIAITHKVSLTDYYIYKYEINNAEFTEFLNFYGSDVVKIGEYKGQIIVVPIRFGLQKNGKLWEPSSAELAKHPVVGVSWFGANEFCKFWKLQLPSEAQWEFAAGGGQNSRLGKTSKDTLLMEKWAGTNTESELKYYAWYERNSDSKTQPVGTTSKANSLDLYDMSGNIWEWCIDWYDENYYKYSEDQTNPINLQISTNRVNRGGSWNCTGKYCRTNWRNYDVPDHRSNDHGFRPCFVP